ncbi:DUF2993 domain-containing protein [Kineosporia rhizophila]|uniref:LmeA family phospholipid-binding protein n=1 Tax=Kineosporia rhizophila TaxID=84633 RepID=UPI001E36C00A|nr:DUF2993 domain-containing protein [Kineosporia rhizophila]
MQHSDDAQAATISEPDTEPGEELGQGRPPRRRNRRRLVLISALTCVVLLVALAVVANLVLTQYVKDGVVQALRCATGDDTITPKVSLGERPMLVELAAREVEQVTISGLAPDSMQPAEEDAAVEASPVAGGELSITLHGLGLGDPPTLKSAEAAVSLPWDSLAGALAAPAEGSADDLAGATLGEQDGLLAVTLPEDVAGQPLQVLVSLEPDGKQMTVTPQSIVIGGRTIGVGLISLFAGDLLNDENGESQLKPRSVDLDLPEGATLEKVRVQSQGLALDLAIDPSMVQENGAAGRDCLA